MTDEAREIHPFGKDLFPTDRRFDPVVVPSEAEDPAPKGLSVQELVSYSDTIPDLPPETREESEETVTLESDLAGAARATTPSKVKRPGRPPSS